MSQNTTNKEIEVADDVLKLGLLKPNKQKHNSKRRRSKKNSNSKINEVVNLLCSAILKDESETPVDINPPVKVVKEPWKSLEACDNQNNRPDCCQISPSNSAAGLCDLFENLQVHTLKNPVKSNNITDFLNIELLKKSNCESLSINDLNKLNPVGSQKSSSEEQKNISNEELKEYFNLDLIQKHPEKTVISQIDAGSTHLVSGLQQTAYSSLSETEDNVTHNKIFSDYFNVNALLEANNNLLTSIKSKSKSKLLVNELEKTLLEEKTQKNPKKKSSNRKRRKNVVSDKSKVFDGSQKVYLNSKLHQKDETLNSKLSNSSQLSKKKKKQLRAMNADFWGLCNENSFPEHLSNKELQSLASFGILFSGIIRINQKNYKEAYITPLDKGTDILIDGLKDRNRALEGDEVYYLIKPKEHHRSRTDSADVQRTGVVVAIKEFNHNRGAVGSLNAIKSKHAEYAVFSPRDVRVPRIRINRRNWPPGFSENSERFKDKLYFARILQWTDMRFADGDLEEEVGVAGDLKSETNAILLKYGLDFNPFADDVVRHLPPSDFKIPECELSKREDFRNECVFTIDPETAVDLDDALSCRRLLNGNYEVGVHISDVSFFVTYATSLDFTASVRATTVYLVQKAYHMLPYELCRICSLTPGEDKLSFSVMWEITPNCRIVGHRFARTVINSCAQFSYGQIQSIIDGESLSEKWKLPTIHGGHKIEEIKEIVLFLNKVANILHAERFKNGALRIDQKKIYFTLDENCYPIEYKVEARLQSHQLIEEFMLLANITVAKKLNSSFPRLAFLRQHSPPLQHILEKLQRSLEKYGIILDISTSGSLQASLLRYAGDDFESVARLLVLNNLIAKPMSRAKYYCSSAYRDKIDRRHYALNVPLYTHFTSPIRRYADIMVHRLLLAALGYTKLPQWTPEYIQSVADHCNKQKYAAKIAGEMSTELYLSVYIGLKGVIVSDAIICDIKDKSFDCIVLSTGAHQKLYFENIKAAVSVEKESDLMRLVLKWPKDDTYDHETTQIIEMFTIVKIEMRRGSVLKIDASLLRNE